MKHLCIYHKDCADGFGSAMAVKSHWDISEVAQEDQEFISAHYGDIPPDVKGKVVLIVDFSYDRETLLSLHSQAAKLTVIDHHKTAKENLEGLEFCHFDMKQSGAMLAWKYFFAEDWLLDATKTDNVPLLIQYIQDRDLWKWKLSQSKEVSAALQAMPMNFETWMPYLDDKNFNRLKLSGEVILQYQKTKIDNVVNADLPMINLCGFDVPCINTTTLISEIGNELSKDYAFAVMYFDTEEKRIYSLRSQDWGEDVSAIAKQFGGGGHPNAAGFGINQDEMLVNTFNPLGGDVSTLVLDVSDGNIDVSARHLATMVMNKRGFYGLSENGKDAMSKSENEDLRLQLGRLSNSLREIYANNGEDEGISSVFRSISRIVDEH